MLSIRVWRTLATSEAFFTTEVTALLVVGSNPKIVFPELLADPNARTVRTSPPRFDLLARGNFACPVLSDHRWRLPPGVSHQHESLRPRRQVACSYLECSGSDTSRFPLISG